MDNENNLNQNQEQEGGIDLNMLLSYFLQYWKWFAVSVFVCLLCAFVYLRYATKIYQVTAKVILKDDHKGNFSSQTDILTDFGFQASNTNVENEIEVLNSISVVQAAVLNSGLYVQYYADGLISDNPIYKKESYVNVDILHEDLSNLLAAIEVKFSLNSDSLYEVSYKYENKIEALDIESEPELITSYPYLLKTVKGNLLISENLEGEKIDGVTAYIYPLKAMTLYFKNGLSVQPVSKTASVSIITINDAVPMNGIDFINALIASYNKQADDDKNEIAKKTEIFINERIKEIGGDLSRREEKLSGYKKTNQLVDPKLDAPIVLQSQSEYVAKLEEVNLLISQLKHLQSYINDPKNDKQSIPTVLGLVNDASLNAMIARYNVEVANRNELLRTATDKNIVLLSATENVERMQEDIREALLALDSSLQIQKQSLTKLVNEYNSRVAATPEIERTLTDLTRESEIKSQLYVMLLQKFEENALALAVTADNLKCVDPASCYPYPVAPRKMMVLAMALFVGVLIPTGIIYLRVLLRTKIEGLEDLDKLTTLPVVGSVPMKTGILDKRRSIVVEENVNDIMAEAFRSIRTNLQFVTKNGCGKVIMFTSTTSGEGKTFVSSNLAVSQAILGKKVLLMGLDIRRPRLAEVFHVDRHKPGITNFLIGDGSDVDSLKKLIIPSGVTPNLDLLPAGIVPPNPAELLAKDNLDKAIKYLSEIYDYIIMDTAPVGLVTDSIIMSHVADVVVYVTRVDYTDRADINFLNSLVKEKKLQNATIVLNAEDLKKGGKGYGRGRYKYGYSYYGFRYGVDEEASKKK